MFEQYSIRQTAVELKTDSERGLSAAEAAARLKRDGVTQSAVSHQLRTLKQAGLVKYRREGKSLYYSIADSHVSTMLATGLEHISE